MKTLKAFFLSFILITISQVVFAQDTRQDTLNVAGVCGMCKKKIETAARAAGASFATWSPDTRTLIVAYNPAASNTVKIQQSIAATGYDTPEVKASEAAYNNLHACCKYDRTAAAAKSDCCASGKCVKSGDCCNGEEDCGKDAACCVQGSTDCCKDGTCTRHAKAKKA